MFLPSVQTISNLPGSCRSFPSQRPAFKKWFLVSVARVTWQGSWHRCFWGRNDIFWLVVDQSLWKMMEFVSWDDDIPNIWKIKHVPNHQPDIYIYMIPFPIHPIRLAVPISSGTQCIIWKCPSVAIYKITALANTYIISPKNQNLLVTCQYHQAQQHYKIGTPRSYEQLY